MNIVNELFSLRDRVALITGASSGIGQGIAEAFAQAGARVVLVARRAERLSEAVEAIRAAGGAADYVACDLGQRSELAQCAERAASPFGAPDILVNAAGINIRQRALEVDGESWDRTLEINLTAPFILAQRLVPGMQQKKWGRVINIASLQSVRAFPNSIAYGASKGGILQLTRAMAEAWSPSGINCNAIAPGYIPTELTAAITAKPEVVADLAAKTMVGRNGRVDDLYGAALFLASRASDFVTGHTLFVDGGFTAR